MRRLAGLLLLVAACAACGSPPEKEYHQAVGAIEAARAAGAGTYAPDALQAAEQALTRYAAAVDQRDFRQALSHALDARERATAAAAKAASDKALFRGDAERRIPVLTASLERARAAAAAATRAQAPAARALRQTITATEQALQEARAALGRDDVVAARKALDGAEARLAEALKAFEPAAASPAPARR